MNLSYPAHRFQRISLCLVLLATTSVAQDVAFDKITLTEEFHSEGIAAGDINGDEILDIVSGPFWYQGPEFKKRFRYMQYDPSNSRISADRSLSIKGYSQHFFTWTDDLDEDGDTDILTVGMPGNAAFWFENPNNSELKHQNWVRRNVLNDISNESPTYIDLTGDGKRELVCLHQGNYVYIRRQTVKGLVSFQPVKISDGLGYGRFTHGLGVGDVDGDGRVDLLETNGWWRQRKAGMLFQFNPYRFAQSGGAQMFAYDFDGDGDNDVICSQNAHGYGLKWFEQVRSNGKIDFVARSIMTEQTSDNPFGLAVSQMHAAALVDLDSDGVKDFVTGKRFWAHGGADPGSRQLPVLFWLKTIRKKERVIFEPRFIDGRSGVGTQVTVSDINGDGKPDLAIGNKLGSYLFLQKEVGTAASWADQPLRAGSELFYESVRSSKPLTPAEQQKTFVLPEGFEIQLVAAEPDINKPMNLAFDHRGRLWVSSSREYPYAAKQGEKTGDAIKILEDTNRDGRADKVTTFAEDLNIPMGLLPYGDGVICFSIPNIWFLHDTDGDDKVDAREILYGPFDTSRDTHGMCSSFCMGNDGWIYACHGFNNQSTVKGRDGHEVTMNSGHTFRFRPDGSRIELVTRGQVNPFGMAIDFHGDIFTADCHTRPINLVLPGGYHDSFGKPHDGLGYIPNVMEHLHDSTGIGGVALGENSAFPTVYRNSTFGGNVVTGRVNRNHLIYTGSSMTAREESDFVIPGDPWFRPVNLQFGPDGSLYIADFYNRIIGHYEVDLDHPGRDRERGRIWKVIYRGDPGRRDHHRRLNQSITESSVEKLGEIARELKTANRTRAIAIIEWILDRSRTNPFLLINFIEMLANNKNAHERQIYWKLVTEKRAGILTWKQEQDYLASEFESVRCLAYQLLPELSTSQIPAGELRKQLIAGMRDLSPFVRRFAALAAAKHPQVAVTNQLVWLLDDSLKQGDRFLAHAAKIALREQFRVNPKEFRGATSKVPDNAIGAFADICMAVQSADAAAFIVKHLTKLAVSQPDQLTSYLEFAARHADMDSIDSIVQIAREQFGKNQEFQLEILDSLRVGIEKQQREMPNSIRSLASEIANKLLRLPTPHWRVIRSNKPVPFSPRKLKWDGEKTNYFIDSLASGETATGLLRSSPFELKNSLSFRIAGHDDTKGKPHKKNLVRIILTRTGQSLGMVGVPQQDTPTRYQLDTRKHAGSLAQIEIIDNCDQPSFAWIAVGDIQPMAELNADANWNLEPEFDTLNWTCWSTDPTKRSELENIFIRSTRRMSADGMKQTPLWSSIVNGEQRTGIYRSDIFTLEREFSFYLAGHDGFPDKPINRKNFVQLKLASSGKVIHKISPPRNDTAQPVTWDTRKWEKELAFIEIVDQDSASAFAWLAAGRFSIPGLNPDQKNGDRLLGCQIISRFGLANLRKAVIRLIESAGSPALKSELCKTLIALAGNRLSSRTLFDVSADLMASPKSDLDTISLSQRAIQNFDANLASEVIHRLLSRMTVSEQTRVAEILSADQSGTRFLLASFESGRVTTSILRQPGLIEKLTAHGIHEVNQKLEQLVQSIPKADPALVRLVDERKQSFASRKVDVDRGKEVYRKNCSNCHQMEQIGTQVGPNLDGIGNRGLDRLVDDILLPNRNVDAAFRSSLIATADGRVYTGLIKTGTSEATLLLVNNEGQVTLIPKADIEQRKETTNSPMPANFGETLSPQDFTDLVGYLLSKRN